MNAESALGWQFERFLLNRFSNCTAANALNANLHRLGSATRNCGADFLQVRAELPTSDSGYLGTDSTEILGFTTRLNTIAHLGPFSTYFTNASHDFIR